MSMATCRVCASFVDTDEEPEFFDFTYTTANGYGGHCESCRNEIYDAMSEAEQAEHERRTYG